MSYKILLIDDDPDILLALERELKDLFDLITAADGESGLEILEKQGPFAVIVSDCVMPGMSGVEVLTRACRIMPDCVRIMLTGHANLTMAIEAVNKGNIFRLLTKPWEHDVLVQTLNSAIEQYRLVTTERELLNKTMRLTESLTQERQNLEIANQKLQEAITKAQFLAQKANASNVAKTEFLANMSHELRTPLSGVIGMLDLTLDTVLNEQQREYITLAKFSANSLLHIVNDILDFARIESGKLVMANAAFSLHHLIEATVAALTPKADSKKLKFEYTLDEEVPDRLVGDADRLRQILLNLLGNALKFTEQGAVTLTVHVERSGDRCLLHFSITDTGIGIAEEKQQTIFDSFTQADGSITRRYSGTGLGLTISKALVEKMGGKIWFESRPNQGSAFHFTALLEPSPEAPVLPKKAVEKGTRSSFIPSFEELPPVAEKHTSILLVDDDEINRSMTAFILAKKGYNVKTAADGREAIHVLQSEPFDLVLMDIQMPGLDGLSATRLIREAGNPVPIIALSASVSESDRQRYQEVGINAYADKPIVWEELLGLIERYAPASAGGPAPAARKMEFVSSPVNNPETPAPVIQARFFEQVSQQLTLLKEALAKGLEKPIEGHAHQIKKLAAYSGAGRISDEAFRLELAARRSHKESYADLVQRIETELEIFRKAQSPSPAVDS